MPADTGTSAIEQPSNPAPVTPVRITEARVKVMRSYDYCHFEVTLAAAIDEAKHWDREPAHITSAEVDDLRKRAARLADKAVEQYKIAKEVAQNLDHIKHTREVREAKVNRLREIPEGERTPAQQASIKAFDDEQFEARCERRRYDYEDDFERDDLDDDPGYDA